MKDKSKNIKLEYSTTGFSDLIASPFFLSILVLTFILGCASVFGFFQNPRKLKFIIDLISQSISISEVQTKKASKVVSSDMHSLSQKKLQVMYERKSHLTFSSLDKERYSVLSEDFVLNKNLLDSVNKSIPTTFDYDITSNNFWKNLDISGLALDEPSYKNSDLPIIDTSISPYYSLEEDSSKYILSINNMSFSLKSSKSLSL